MADLTCTGRPVDDTGRAHGQPCGRRLRARAGQLAQVARAAGWAVTGADGPRWTGTCPRCRRPAPEVAALAQEVRRG